MKKTLAALVMMAASTAMAGGIPGFDLGGTSANATSINTNVATNRVTNVQGQLQGQQQGIANSGNSASHSTANSGGNILTNGQTNSQSTGATSQTTTNDGNNSHNAASGNSVNVAAQERNPVSTAYAPSIMPTAVCMGSSSGGIQGASFGVSVGSSWTDANCMLLEQVRTTSTILGDQATAAEMMCAVPAYKEARVRTGKPCGGDSVRTSAAAPVSGMKRSSATQYTDPIIRARLGLQPL